MIGRLRLPLLTSYSRRCCSVLLSPPTSGSVILNTVAISDPDLLSSESLLSAITNLNQPKLLSVAIVGQPNVGKSTLFNKLTAHSRAIVTPIPGTTRDRRDGKGHLAGLDMNVIDTGGFDDRGAVTGDIKDQIKRALMQADVVLYVVDGKHGINTIDLIFSQWLRKTLGVIEKYYPKTHSLKREVILVANKTEGAHLSNRVLDTVSEAARLGQGEPLLISASHGDGLADVAQELIRCAQARGLDTFREEEEKVVTDVSLHQKTIQMALMGRPNVGKSSLLNAILKDERVITGPTPGLTRDAIYVEWIAQNRFFRLVDTAGLTHIRPNKALLKHGDEKKVLTSREKFGIDKIKLPGIKHLDPEVDPSQFSKALMEQSLESALTALRFAHVVVLVVEGEQGNFTATDMKIAQKCHDEGRALVICANKRDVVAQFGVSARQYEKGIRQHCEQFLREFGELEIVSTAAVSDNESSMSPPKPRNPLDLLNNPLAINSPEAFLEKYSPQGVDRLLRAVIRTHDAWSSRINTWVLNTWLRDLQVSIPQQRSIGRVIKVKYMTQIKARPPTFVVFSNRDVIPPSYISYFRNRLQKDFKLHGVPLRFVFRKSTGREADPLKLSYSKKKWVRNAGESRPVGPKRFNRFLEIQRKMRQDVRRRKASRGKRIKRGAGKYVNHVKNWTRSSSRGSSRRT